MFLLAFTFVLISKTVFSITLENVASPNIGIDFGRTGSAEFLARQQVDAIGEASDTFLTFDYPVHSDGNCGPGMIDFNNDDHIDILVPNGPNSPNSLYKNNGDGTYTDIGVLAGISDEENDGSGVCFGDLDNDGYDDIVISGKEAYAFIYWNNGNETFTKSDTIAVPGTNYSWTAGCSIGDINNDGYLDIYIANAVRAVGEAWVFIPGFEFIRNDHNELYLNNGDRTFSDVTETSGIKDTVLFPTTNNGKPTISWASAMVDINGDGNIDIIMADDQAGQVPAVSGGIDRGLLHIFLGNGDGTFVDTPQMESGFFNSGSYMGTSFGDLNCDGELDIFTTNFGEYAAPNVIQADIFEFGFLLNRPMYGKGSAIANFDDPVWELKLEENPTPFGFGCAIFDIDNDGDLDIIYHGGLDHGKRGIEVDNPGIIYLNEGCDNLDSFGRSHFTRDLNAIPYDPDCQNLADGFTVAQTCTQHNLRVVKGTAIADLNNDGFDDVITLATWNFRNSTMKFQLPFTTYGDPLDDTAFIIPLWSDVDGNDNRQFIGGTYGLGDLSLEMNSADNGNNYVQFLLNGGMGNLDQQTYPTLSNRNAVGAIITVTPTSCPGRKGGIGNPITIPITAGDSFASQHAFRKTFGLGNCRKATVEIIYPSGFKNILTDINKNSFEYLYEMPVSYDNCSLSRQEIQDIIQDAGNEYGLSNSIINDYKRSFRMANRQECKNNNDNNQKGAANSHNGGASGNYFYLIIVGAILGFLLIGFGVLVMVRKRMLKKQVFDTNQKNIEAGFET